MTKLQSKYVCQSCAYESARWVGKCPNCESWNSLVEEVVASGKAGRKSRASSAPGVPVSIQDVDAAPEGRTSSGIPELNRVLGGGIVAGSVVLVGGDPGIGKSTLMMQMASALSGQTTLYITGEESVQQIKLRAERLAVRPSPGLLLLAETNLEVIENILQRQPPDMMIVDSIQTMVQPDFESAPGTVSQVRESTAFFARIARAKGIPTFLVGHVTKEGVIAGPRVIEHMVDTVLQFEGEHHYAYRILRATKNRFGSTNEIGIFEMHDGGLKEVENPSQAFLAERRYGSSGSTVVAGLEGTRPLLLELQALVAPTSYGVPQRTATGFDSRRLQMLLAVLEKRAGLRLGQYDVFVNVAGGVRVDEPAADLGMALAIVSSLRDIPAESQTVVVGEVGLGGEVRTVSQVERRAMEAAKLGFTRILIPRNSAPPNVLRKAVPGASCEVLEVETITQAIDIMLGS